MAKSPSVPLAFPEVQLLGVESNEVLARLHGHLALTKGFLQRSMQSRFVDPGSTLDKIKDPYVVLARNFDPHSQDVRLYAFVGGYMLISHYLGRNEIYVAVYADTFEQGTKIQADIALLLPRRKVDPEKQVVPFNFWTLTSQGPRAVERRLDVSTWKEVEANYSVSTRGHLSNLMVGFKPSKAGQLILWYGPPGTGKTHALRAMAWEWRKWCSAHYVVDPEVFFGGSANYMMDVILQRNDDDDDYEGTEVSTSGKYRLLILEDSGELMTVDAKANVGQGLSRLLNVVDGLIGQGLKLMVLVTTNELLGKLHPAIARPGRCAARIEFGPLAGKDIQDFYNSKQVALPDNLRNSMTLAECYEKLTDAQIANSTPKPQAGFGTL